MSRQKELDADLKAVEKIEFVGGLKYYDGVSTVGNQSMLVTNPIQQQINETKIFSRELKRLLQNVKLSRNKG